jgi:hypothetical protein
MRTYSPDLRDFFRNRSRAAHVSCRCSGPCFGVPCVVVVVISMFANKLRLISLGCQALFMLTGQQLAKILSAVGKSLAPDANERKGAPALIAKYKIKMSPDTLRSWFQYRGQNQKSIDLAAGVIQIVLDHPAIVAEVLASDRKRIATPQNSSVRIPTDGVQGRHLVLPTTKQEVLQNAIDRAKKSRSRKKPTEAIRNPKQQGKKSG